MEDIDPAVEAANRVLDMDWEDAPDVWVMIAREAQRPLWEAMRRLRAERRSGVFSAGVSYALDEIEVAYGKLDPL